MRPDQDTVDLREIGSAIRHGRRWIIGGAIVGVALGGLATALVRPTYEGTATILLRSDAGGGAAALASSSGEDGISLGGLANMLSMGSGFDTEMEIITSRSVATAVVDSLGLQAQVVQPVGRSPGSVFAAFYFPHGIKRSSYHFEDIGAGYRVQGAGIDTVIGPGSAVLLGYARVVLQKSGLPAEFEVELVGMEEAIRRFRKRLTADKAGGDVAELVYDSGDPITAAAVPNAIIAQYLKRRKTTDRGINQHRYEFLAHQADSTEAALVRAAEQLRRAQEQSGVLDPEIHGEKELEQAARLRAQLQDIAVESRGLGQVLARGPVSARDVAAYPTLLRNGAINGILGRLSIAEERRAELLERRTERDPDVALLNNTITQLQDELITLSRSYLDGLTRQETQLRQELARYEATLAALPAHAEESFRLKREVERLSETLVALRTQLVQTRLAAMSEGGEIRPVDLATPPEKPEYPKPLLNLAGGLIGGIFFGTAAAIGTASLQRRIREPWDAELATGVPATRLCPDTPLLIQLAGEERVVCVIPVGREAHSGLVAERLTATAVLQGRPAVCVSLDDTSAARVDKNGGLAQLPAAVRSDNPPGGALRLAGPAPANGYSVYYVNRGSCLPLDGRAAVEELARRFTPVVVSLPSLDEPLTVAVLALHPIVVLTLCGGRVDRTELQVVAQGVERAGATLVGVVIEDGKGGGVDPAEHRPWKSDGVPPHHDT